MKRSLRRKLRKNEIRYSVARHFTGTQLVSKLKLGVAVNLHSAHIRAIGALTSSAIRDARPSEGQHKGVALCSMAVTCD